MNAEDEWIKRLVGAWDCCGTCAGGVLAERDRRIIEQAERRHADLVARVEALAARFKRQANEDWTAHTEAADMGDLDAANIHGAEGQARDDIASRLRAALAATRDAGGEVGEL